MLKILCVSVLVIVAGAPAIAAERLAWPSMLPVYDHIVIVIEENKDVEQIFGGGYDAPYLRQLAAEGALMSRIFGEEHYKSGKLFLAVLREQSECRLCRSDA